jgi:hypothetical protein
VLVWGVEVKTNDEMESFLTSRQACDAAGYSRPSSFLRAWRAAGLPEAAVDHAE